MEGEREAGQEKNAKSDPKQANKQSKAEEVTFPSAVGTLCNGVRTFTSKPRLESGLDSLICDMFARTQKRETGRQAVQG